MLQNMHIKNIVLIDEIDISFEDRLNILTGETGAGKSIIIGSLGICLGGKFSKELLRDDTKDGLIELLFTVEDEGIKAKLSDLGIEAFDELLISRRLSTNGKTVSRINGETVTTATLKRIAALLIDLHAQHEQQTLLKEDKHLAILDSFGKEVITPIKQEVKLLYAEYSGICDELKAADIDEAGRNRELDYIKYQIEEIRAAALKAGEDEELEAFYRKALNSKEIIATVDDVYKLTGDGNISCESQMERAVSLIKRLSDLDDDMAPLYDSILSIEDMLGEFNRELKNYMRDMEFDEREFSEAESRLNLINSLKLKYGNSIEDILDSLSNLEKEYDKLLDYDEYIEGLKGRLNAVSSKLDKECSKLTAARKEESIKLCNIIRESLEDLNFMTVYFDMRFGELDRYTANGKDEACFMISTNVGETARPLSEIASGGELSRVMLAIKSCLANEDDIPSLVFDEIDVGISGRTAQKVAEKLSVIASKHQVICITHLPQIAAMADAHYLIEKKVEKSKTISNIRALDASEQIDEIARLLGGAEITEATIASARDMKGLAEKTKLY